MHTSLSALGRSILFGRCIASIRHSASNIARSYPDSILQDLYTPPIQPTGSFISRYIHSFADRAYIRTANCAERPSKDDHQLSLRVSHGFEVGPSTGVSALLTLAPFRAVNLPLFWLETLPPCSTLPGCSIDLLLVF
jgi:hypothetical protein